VRLRQFVSCYLCLGQVISGSVWLGYVSMLCQDQSCCVRLFHVKPGKARLGHVKAG
jgi:hypothetical protein